MALQPFLGPWPHISVSKSILLRRLDSLDEWSARRKASTYRQDNTNTLYTNSAVNLVMRVSVNMGLQCVTTVNQEPTLTVWFPPQHSWNQISCACRWCRYVRAFHFSVCFRKEINYFFAVMEYCQCREKKKGWTPLVMVYKLFRSTWFYRTLW
jgi:hypothetical protein